MSFKKIFFEKEVRNFIGKIGLREQVKAIWFHKSTFSMVKRFFICDLSTIMTHDAIWRKVEMAVYLKNLLLCALNVPNLFQFYIMIW